MDRHQKVRQFRQGDILALPAGLTLWFYNNGGEPLITVALLDTGNAANQLDQTFRHFFLAGNPQGGRQSYFGRPQTEKQQGGTNNIFNGFDDEILADAFGVDVQTARRLKGQDDLRGRIVRAERLDIVLPGEEEEERWERDPYSGANGLEETLCTAKLRENLDEPARADVYNPHGGRISSLNSLTLPVLSWLRLSAEKGVLYRNGLVAPHWNLNAHSIIYITRGSGRFQVVGHTGRSVFDGVVREGQLIIVPQNYVVAKRASQDEGLEWISFKTNDNAMTSQLAGRLSAIRAMPEEVVMTAYQVSRDEARRLKYNREESRVFSSTSRYSWPRSSRPMSYMPKPFEYALDVIKSMM
ncbi:UNVERIFIED_CONTAM: 11S globulin seed storage protein Jug r 4 [Sesamum indicum]